MEIAFVSANKVRVEIDVKKSGLINRIIHVFYNHSDMFISTLLIGNNVVNVVYSIAMSALLTEPLKHTAVGGNEVLMLLLMLTIVGISWGKMHISLMGLAVAPFGKMAVR